MSFLTLTLTLLSFTLLFNNIISISPVNTNITKPQEPAKFNNNVTYHFGPVISSDITVFIIWYGSWPKAHKQIIRDFINSISGSHNRSPSVSGWWKTAQLYTDQTGSNVSGTVLLGSENNDRFMSHGKNLTFRSIQSIIKAAMVSKTNPLPIDPKGGIYLVLTAPDVQVQHFCHQTCGFHYFTFPSIVGDTLPYAWVGNSATQCPDVCAMPFAVPAYLRGMKPLKSPNGDVGIDGMVIAISRELVNVVTNPLLNGWYDDGHEGLFIEIGDMCAGKYGAHGDGTHIGRVMYGGDGAVYNVYGIRRRFLVQWIWDGVGKCCGGLNGQCD